MHFLSTRGNGSPMFWMLCYHTYNSISNHSDLSHSSQTPSPFAVKSCSDLHALPPCPLSFSPSISLGKNVYFLRMANGWHRNDTALEVTGTALSRFALAREASPPSPPLPFHTIYLPPQIWSTRLFKKKSRKATCLKSLNSSSWNRATCYCGFWPPGVGLDDFPHGLLWKVLLCNHLTDPPAI